MNGLVTNWSSPETEPPKEQEEAPSVSPVQAPPSEVKVRTFASDLKSMAESGGGPPEYEKVKGPPIVEPRSPKRPDLLVNRLFVVLVPLAALLILGLGFYFFIYPRLGGKIGPDERGPAALPPKTSILEQRPAEPRFDHRSFLKKAPDGRFVLRVGSVAASASDLSTYSQKVIALLGNAKPASTLFEIAVQDSEGGPVSIRDFLGAIDAQVVSQDFLEGNFNSDFTYFVYKDKNGYWPGYILELKPGKNWLFLRSDTLVLEASPKLANLFLVDPGNIQGTFADGVVSGQPVRAAVFTKPGAVLTYGWFRGYFIVGTSQDGLKRALEHL